MKLMHALTCGFSLALLAGCVGTEEADLIIHNARIYTVDETFSVAEAMAIRGDSIVEVGPEHQIRNKYRTAAIVDAAKQFIYPGFIDAHAHFLGFGLTLQKVDLIGTTSYADVLERVQAFAATHPNGWITGRGWDQNDWPEKVYPNKAALDSLFPDRPVALRRVDGHAALVNQRALDLAGITPATTVEGGYILAEDGELTGILIDGAYTLVSDVIPAPTTTQLSEGLMAAEKACFAVGLTTVTDAGLNHSDVQVIDSLQQAGDLRMQLYVMLSDNAANFEHYLTTGPLQTERLNVRSFKFYADGALGSRGACLLAPYHDAAENDFHGTLLQPIAHYRERARDLYEAGFQMNTHCIGDSANRMILDVYGDVLKGVNDLRWRIEHAQVVHPDDLDKFGQYSVVPSVQPTHATSDMYWAAERLGPDRMASAYSYRELLEQNRWLPLGTDFPVESIDPLTTFYAAVARQDREGYPPERFQPDNGLSRQQALQGMTIWAALANFEERAKGSLQAGKKADFVILDQDLMSCPESAILETKVLATYVRGERVYERLNP